MPKRKIRFMGLLTNTDSSILGVKLEHGFKIEKISGRELIEFITKLEKIPEFSATQMVVEKSYLNLEDKKVYLISNLIDDIEVTETGELDNKNFHVLSNYDTKYYDLYLYDKLALMRLFKEGCLFMPDRYYFFDDDESLIMVGRGDMHRHFMRRSRYSLEESELQDLQVFLQNIEFPFKESSLRLAHENFEISYSIYHEHLSFLVLMMSMESLFNPSGEGELRYRISRNTAVLIGRDKDDSEIIWKKMRELYDKRCEIVHEGKSNIVTSDAFLVLRDYVRRSIKEFYKLGKSKEKILEMLNSCGFGVGPWFQQKSQKQ
jgi:hypothetical protein